MVWIVGRGGGEDGQPFQFQGVFDSEEKAVAACRDDSYFIGPAILNDELPHEKLPGWPGAYYPALETADEAAARIK